MQADENNCLINMWWCYSELPTKQAEKPTWPRWEIEPATDLWFACPMLLQLSSVKTDRMRDIAELNQ